MPSGLVRYQEAGGFHFVPFSCYRREPLLARGDGYAVVERALERVRRSFRLVVAGYVFMLEHVHLLVSEPEQDSLAVALMVLKQESSKLLRGEEKQFWQRRYYDFHVRTEEKTVEKLKYMHPNPVVRGVGCEAGGMGLVELSTLSEWGGGDSGD